MPPRKPATGSAAARPAAARSRADGEAKGTVKPHRRRTKDGSTEVKKHNRKTTGSAPRSTATGSKRGPAARPTPQRSRATRLKQAGNVWAGAGASGLVATGMLFELAFTAITVAALIAAVLLKTVAYLLTGQEAGPTRRRRKVRRTARRATSRGARTARPAARRRDHLWGRTSTGWFHK